ncbi:hypothetical protein Goklo_024434 [Gossypium klotzschianum]|uniref:Uncharacterized protein n=1 Tax=Gossypium klotzschianum TaxID=34286 RepID=A0A7J8W8R5_9ROSI|nr:hypothetical protein [Gossypium klotzschianum]
MMRSSNYSTVITMIYLIYSVSKWTSTYSEPLPSFGILLIVTLLLEKWIWCLLWKSTQPCFGAQRFKLTRHILELSMSRP